MNRKQQKLLEAAANADWIQVVYNQGPPCFHLDGDRFCLRAGRWDGHKDIGGSGPVHKYVPLDELLLSVMAPGTSRTKRTRTRNSVGCAGTGNERYE